MSVTQHDRLHAEVSLLEAMYPDQVNFDEKASEIRYHSDRGSFQLRLPHGYLHDQLPEVLSARSGHIDLRENLKQHTQGCPRGVEVLDFVVSSFIETLEHLTTDETSDGQSGSLPVSDADSSKVTIVVWLHHLLNTNKRKQAISPSPGVSGVTKPGYPGVLIYSGSAEAVHEHVNALKQLNWQAFQVRLEIDDEWPLAHGTGVKEVETMKEVVAEIGEVRKELFMEAMRMK